MVETLEIENCQCEMIQIVYMFIAILFCAVGTVYRTCNIGSFRLCVIVVVGWLLVLKRQRHHPPRFEVTQLEHA